MGGSAEQVTTYLKDRYQAGVGLDDAIRLAVQGLGQGATESRTIPSANLEVAVLDRTRSQQRKFKRLTGGAARPDPRQRQRQRPNGDGPSDGGPSDGGSGGPSTDPSGPDDPADPTDTAGAVPPLEDPVTGEPNGPDDAPVAPPIS